MPEHDALDALIAGAAGWNDADLGDDPALRSALDDLCGDLMSAGAPRRRFRLRPLLGGGRGALAAALATAAVILAVPAVGKLTADHSHLGAPHPLPPGTSWQRPGGGFPLIPQSQPGPQSWQMRGDVAWANVEGSAFPGLLKDLGGVFPIPPGGGWDYLVAHHPGKGWILVDDLGQSMLRNAVCEWEYYWLDRTLQRDDGRATQAWSALRRISAWTFVTPDGRGGTRTVTVVSGAVRPDPALVRQDLGDFCHPTMWSRPPRLSSAPVKPGASA